MKVMVISPAMIVMVIFPAMIMMVIIPRYNNNGDFFEVQALRVNEDASAKSAGLPGSGNAFQGGDNISLSVIIIILIIITVIVIVPRGIIRLICSSYSFSTFSSSSSSLEVEDILIFLRSFILNLLFSRAGLGEECSSSLQCQLEQVLNKETSTFLCFKI